MVKTKNSDSAKRELIKLLRSRIKSLYSARQIYAQNAAFPKNVKVANIEIIQNDLESLKNILKELTKI